MVERKIRRKSDRLPICAKNEKRSLPCMEGNMKTHKTAVFLAMVAILAALPLTFLAQSQNNNRAEVQFQAAQHKAFVDGDLKGAIEQYKQIASGRDRAMAAKALVA